MIVYDRAKKEYVNEVEPHEGLLKFLYQTMTGRLLLKFIVKPSFSKWYGRYYNSGKSKKDIKLFIDKHGIKDVKEYDIETFQSFNDFFTRQKEVKISDHDHDLISTADSKLSVYHIDKDLRLKIKNSSYSLDDILDDVELAKQFINGLCLVFRLSLTDYHRYIYIDDGFLFRHYEIAGELHTVRSISEKFHVFSRNHRIVSVLKMKHLGDVVQVEVGALTIGAIHNYNKPVFFYGDEKGYFGYGGSTIVIFLKHGVVKIDSDIAEQSEKGIETKVNIGERIGKIC